MQNETTGSLAGKPMFEQLERRILLSTITVTSAADIVANDGVVTLREAILAANTDADPSGDTPAGSGDDLITFDAGLPTGAVITLDAALGELVIDSNMEIQGPGADAVTIDAAGNSRVFHAEDRTVVRISGLTVTGGMAYQNGGGILLGYQGELTLGNMHFTGNRASSNGGAVYNWFGDLTVEECVFTGNSAGDHGGAIESQGGNLVIIDSSFIGNQADSNGGAINTFGSLTVQASRFEGNFAIRGGALSLHGSSLGPSVSQVIDCLVVNNTAEYSGGINNSTTVEISGTIIAGNTASWGGGVTSIDDSMRTITDSQVFDNQGQAGGGILLGDCVASLVRTSIFRNRTNAHGAGIDSVHGSLNIESSSIWGNIAEGTGGGGMQLVGTTATITNSTISSNTSMHGPAGIYHLPLSNGQEDTLTIRNTTIAGNVGGTTGGIHLSTGGQLIGVAALHNTIVADNVLQDAVTNSDVAGDFDPASSHNLIGAIDGSTGLDGSGTIFGTAAAPLDARLGPLNNDIEQLAYHDVLPGTPAIDAGDNAQAIDPAGSPLLTDQRGHPRLADGDGDGSMIVDMGSIEYYPFDINEFHCEAGGPYDVSEGGSIVLSGFGTSPDPVDVLTFDWDLDGDNVFGETGASARNGDEVGESPTFVAGDLDGPGETTVRLRVTHSTINLVNTDTATVAIHNAAPEVAPLADRTVPEGQTVAISAAFTDAGATDTHTALIDWGDGTSDAGVVNQTTRIVSGEHIYADDGAYTATVDVTDDDGSSGSAVLTVTVENVPPVVTVTTPSEGLYKYQQMTLHATFTDPGLADTWTALIDWGDGTTSIGQVNTTAGSITGNHAYTVSGDYAITVILTDDDGGVGQAGTNVSVLGTGEAFADLLNTVENLGLRGRLRARLNRAIRMYSKGSDPNRIVALLDGFIQDVNRQYQRGKIPEADALLLISRAELIQQDILTSA